MLAATILNAAQGFIGFDHVTNQVHFLINFLTLLFNSTGTIPGIFFLEKSQILTLLIVENLKK